jgi:transposase
MVETRDTAFGAARPEDEFGLYFRRHLPGRRKRRRARTTCNSEAMALHLEEISLAVAPGAHAILLLDQAGWHVSKRLSIPDNITLLLLPPKSPELNPVENIWQFMRDNWPSNRGFKSYDDILDLAASPGISSSTCPGKSCQSGPETGSTVMIIKTWYKSPAVHQVAMYNIYGEKSGRINMLTYTPTL